MMKLWLYFLGTMLGISLGNSETMDTELVQCYKKDNPKNEKFILDESSWELMLQDEWMIGFCVPLIMSCIKFDRIWSKFAQEMQLEDSEIIIGSMKLEYSEEIIRRFSLVDLPTIIHVKDGVFRKLPMVKTVQELKDLALFNWQNAEPMPYWQRPNGLLINAYISYIHLIGMVYHNTWLEMDYEHAIWLVRIALALILGMIITGLCSVYSLIWDGIKVGKKKIGKKIANSSVGDVIVADEAVNEETP